MLAPRSIQAPRCAVLIDFGPEDQEFLHRLLSRPGLSVRLVLDRSSGAAAGPIAATCGAPVSHDLADLTREVFDLALLGSRADRCIELEFLLGAMGTPVRTVSEFLRDEEEDSLPMGQLGPEWLRDPPAPAPSASPAPPAPPPSASPAPPPVATPAPRNLEAPPQMPKRRRTDHPSLGPYPELHDPAGIELALGRWVVATGASAAEVHGGDAEAIQWVCRSGPEDPLLARLATLAFDLEVPQLVTRLDGEHAGTVCAAWPIRPREHRAVLAVAGVASGAPHEAWERIGRELSRAWGDREESVDDFVAPPAPGSPPPADVPAATAPPDVPAATAPPRRRDGWISSDTFMANLIHTTEHDARCSLAVLRITLEGSTELMEALGRMLLDRMPDADAVCRPNPKTLVLMLDGAAGTPPNARRRVVALWHACWQEQGRALPAPPLAIEQVEHASGGDAAALAAVVRHWLS